MIDIQITEKGADGEQLKQASWSADSLDFQELLAAIFGVIAKAKPLRKRRKDAGKKRGAV